MRSLFLAFGTASVLVLAGCNDSNNSNGSSSAEQDATFTLQLLHLADVDGGGTAAMFNVDDFSALTN